MNNLKIQQFRWASKGREKALGSEHMSTLDTVEDLGVLYKIQGKMQKAEAMYWRALKSKETARGPEHTSTINIFSNLGDLYEHQGKMQEADAMYRRALGGFEKAWGPEHMSTLSMLINLGVFMQLKEDARSRGHVSAGVRKLCEIKAPVHAEYGQQPKSSLCSSRQDARGQDRTAGAGRRKEGVGTRAPVNVADSRQSSSSLEYKIQGKIQEAEAIYRRALEPHARIREDQEKDRGSQGLVLGGQRVENLKWEGSNISNYR